MLEGSEGIAFLPSQDLGRSVRFFTSTLGLPLVAESPFACVFRCGSTLLRVTRVDEFRPQPFTAFGWGVEDVRSTVEWLRAQGVSVIRYEGMGQDEDGIWVAPGGALVAWFQDPDGNTLSLTEDAR